MTGMMLGIPSIALSQAFTDRERVRWDTTRRLAPGAIRGCSRSAGTRIPASTSISPTAPAEAGARSRLPGKGWG